MTSKPEDKVLRRNDLNVELPNVSFGRYFFDELKSVGNAVVLVNPKNGSFLTGEQLLQRSIKVAFNLKKGGLKKGDVVAITCENCIDYVVPLLAASYLGIITQAIPSHLTLCESSKLIEISQAKWLFCSNKTLEMSTQLKQQFSFIEEIICFEQCTKTTTLKDLLQVESNVEQFEPEQIHYDEVAALFSSSGTSGFPKCVMLTHRNLVANIIFSKIVFDFQKGDVTVLPLPLSHIYGFIYCVTGVLSAAKNVVMDRFIPEFYLRCIESYRANKLTCPPTLMKFFVESPLIESYDLSSVQEITHGSAPLSEKVRAAMIERFPITLRAGYGLTETTGPCIFNGKHDNKPASCGRILPTLMVKISSLERKEALGPDQQGEICVKGPVVTEGYMGNLEATANAFDEEGYFKTGDIGYYDEDGYVYVVDRLKELIKYKGFQVSPTELEFIIMQHPAVKEVCVIGIPEEKCGEVPVAYVVLKDEKVALEKEIIDLVSDNVNYTKWLYGGVKFVQNIPKTASGKAKRQELKELHMKDLYQIL